MKSRYKVTLTRPAKAMSDAFLLGNGRLGAVFHGSPGEERLDLNLDSVWSGGPGAPQSSPDVGVLPALRAAIRERDDAGADELARRLQGPAYSQSFQPLGWLSWRYADEQVVGEYTRSLDLSRAVADAHYAAGSGRVEVEAFVSAPDDVLVVTARGAVNPLLPHFESPHPTVRVTEQPGGWLVITGRVPTHVTPTYVDDLDAVRYDDDGAGSDGTVAAGMAFAVIVRWERVSADEHRLIVAAESGFRGFDQRPIGDAGLLVEAARMRVAAAAGRTTRALRDRHVDDYRPLFATADLELHSSTDGVQAAAAELYFHLGRYLLISSSRPGTQAANLQGIWNVDVRPAWSSNYTTNINAQMNYWGSEVVGLGELHEPLLQLVEDLAVAGKATARQTYAAGGAAAHHNTDLWRFTAPVTGEPQWANWPMGLLWLAAHFAMRSDYASDASLRADVDARAVVVLREVTRFALDLLVEAPDGTLITSPSTSPELNFIGADGFPLAVTEGAAMDQELIRETFTQWLLLNERSPQALHLDEDEVLSKRVEAALSRLRQVAIAPGGELLEWIDERVAQEPGHRHVSHLYGLYPGLRIDEVGSLADFTAARRALRRRVELGGGYTGWSSAWILCLAGRLRDPALAEHALRALLEELSSDSLLDLHPYGDAPGDFIFQIDGNLGAVAGICGLLVGRTDDGVSLLPALPSSWSSGVLRGVRTNGGHIVDVRWADGRLLEAAFRIGQGGPLTIDVPADAPGRLLEKTGNPVLTREAAAARGRHRRSWNADAGATYTWQSDI